MVDGSAFPGLDFTLDVREPSLRLIGVTLTLSVADCGQHAANAPNTLLLFLPTWTPGSYLIREYSRHVGNLRVVDEDDDAELPSRKLTKNRWELALQPSTRRVRVYYTVYAHELSVRTADLTDQHAYWNHACVLLWPVGRPELAARLTLLHPAGWRLACSLPRLVGSDDKPHPWPDLQVDRHATQVRLLAADLDEAIDAPCLLGTWQEVRFEVDGTPHQLALDGLAGVPLPKSLAADFAAIVQAAARVFGGRLPYPHYTFLCLFAAEGHGGLEHSGSTTLLAARTVLSSPKAYRDFLGLAAHELFHAWNVKRMRPLEFWRYDYENENYSSLLWLMEGWTAYYDDLLCLRAGLMSFHDYLGVVGRNLNSLRLNPGRFELSLAASSFDAWIRLYRPDENTRNSSQNYYGNGAFAALCLDLAIRKATAGHKSLDDLIASLYENTFSQGKGYSQEDVIDQLRSLLQATVAGETVVSHLLSWVNGSFDPAIDALFAPFGLKCVIKEADKPYLGINFQAGSMLVASVQSDGPAHTAGIAPGDEILALADLRVDTQRWAEILPSVAVPEHKLGVLIARRGVIQRLEIAPGKSPGSISIEPDPAADTAAQELRQGWIGAPSSGNSGQSPRSASEPSQI